MSDQTETFESLLAKMSELVWMPLDARAQFDAMLRDNFTGDLNDDDDGEMDA